MPAHVLQKSSISQHEPNVPTSFSHARFGPALNAYPNAVQECSQKTAKPFRIQEKRIEKKK
jgi:hypothetical protein